MWKMTWLPFGVTKMSTGRHFVDDALHFLKASGGMMTSSFPSTLSISFALRTRGDRDPRPPS